MVKIDTAVIYVYFYLLLLKVLVVNAYHSLGKSNLDILAVLVLVGNVVI